MINNLVLFILPIVPVALADVDASYGAHVAAANNILNNNNDGSNVNHRNNYATYHSVKYIGGQETPSSGPTRIPSGQTIQE